MAYDFLIVGAGLFGSVFAREATDKGYKCLVIDKRDHIGGNCYTERVDGIDVHKYGPHTFHTNSEKIWNYVNRFTEFEPFELNVIANHKGTLYSLPFNMNTFSQLFDTEDPEQVKQIIEKERFKGTPTNLEEQALSMVGETVYRTLIYGYTKKQWATDPKNLPKSIITRLPVRFTFDNNYFNDTYQGIPKEGYTKMFENLLDGIDVLLDFDYFYDSNKLDSMAKKIVYTGPIDKFYDYYYGELDYRSLKFEHNHLKQKVYQGCAAMNFTEFSIKHTRIIEHKFFQPNKKSTHTIITKEFPADYSETKDPYYPINNKKNTYVLDRYKQINNPKYILGGRLAEYRYYDMDQSIGSSLAKAEKLPTIR